MLFTNPGPAPDPILTILPFSGSIKDMKLSQTRFGPCTLVLKRSLSPVPCPSPVPALLTSPNSFWSPRADFTVAAAFLTDSSDCKLMESHLVIYLYVHGEISCNYVMYLHWHHTGLLWCPQPCLRVPCPLQHSVPSQPTSTPWTLCILCPRQVTCR